MKLLIVGHSHSVSLINAAAAMGVDHKAVRLSNQTDFGSLRDQVAMAVSALSATAVLPADVSRAMDDADIRALVTVGGNFHNVVGMFEHERPYDFYIPELNDVPLASGCEILQYDAVVDFFYRHLRRLFLTILDVKRLLGAHTVHIDSPPPLEDNEFIRAHIDDYFKRIFPGKMPKINAPAIRLKHWYVAQALYKKFCAEADIVYLENKKPRSRKYYLRKIYVGEDATHANADFSKDYIHSLALMRSQ